MNKLVVFATLVLASNAYAEKWQPKSINDPTSFNFIVKGTMEMDLASLPLAAKLEDDRMGWSETFWPSNKGGIAYRWNSPNPTPFKYKLHSKAELQSMSANQLGELSPAELYDISQGDYKYSLTKKVLATYHTDDLWWEGICHGWALAATHYPEPDKVEIRNKDNIVVPFGSSDVKALLAMHDAYNSKGAYAQVGARCGIIGKVPGEAFPEDGIVPEPSVVDKNSAACSDTNAGAFHVIVTNMLGRFGKGFIADVDRYNDVWNQPVSAFESQILGDVSLNQRDMANGVSRKVRVKTKMTYGDELEFYSAEEVAKGTLGFVSKDPVTGTPAQTNGEKNYEYVLELNSYNQIVGGEWISESRPDFIWAKIKDAKFSSTPGNGTGFLTGLFKKSYPLEGLNQIYRPVRR
jgi:Transglutaminase elicitor